MQSIGVRWSLDVNLLYSSPPIDGGRYANRILILFPNRDREKRINMLYNRLVWSAIFLVTCLCPQCMRADFALLDVTVVNAGGGGISQTLAWEFVPSTAISVTRLGWFDFQSNGLLTSHDLGIYQTNTQQLLASTNIPAGIGVPLDGPPVTITLSPGAIHRFRYADIAPITLSAGVSYVIAGTSPFGTDFSAAYNPISSVLQTAPEISFIQGRQEFASPLTFPTMTSSGVAFGPSFQFTPVPEPNSGLLMFVAGLAQSSLFRTRHNNRKSAKQIDPSKSTTVVLVNVSSS